MRIARYLSKYVSKSFELGGLDLGGRHRYRAARVTLAARSALVLEAGSCFEALDVLLGRLGLVRGDVQVFFFEDWSGFWFSVGEDIATTPPPF